jgi:transposase
VRTRAQIPSSRQSYCQRCDVLLGLDGFHVVEVAEHGDGVRVVSETPPVVEGCRTCGVVTHSHGRREVGLVDVPCFGRPVVLAWRKRTWRCAELTCPAGSITEQHLNLVGRRALPTTMACWWAINQLRREHASVAGLARQLGTASRTVWRSIKPLLDAMGADPSRLENVTTLGVDEHIWHHVPMKPIAPAGVVRGS